MLHTRIAAAALFRCQKSCNSNDKAISKGKVAVDDHKEFIKQQTERHMKEVEDVSFLISDLELKITTARSECSNCKTFLNSKADFDVSTAEAANKSQREELDSLVANVESLEDSVANMKSENECTLVQSEKVSKEASDNNSYVKVAKERLENSKIERSNINESIKELTALKTKLTREVVCLRDSAMEAIEEEEKLYVEAKENMDAASKELEDAKLSLSKAQDILVEERDRNNLLLELAQIRETQERQNAKKEQIERSIVHLIEEEDEIAKEVDNVTEEVGRTGRLGMTVNAK